MAYSIPDGYTLDKNTGLYYSKVIAEDDVGNKSRVVTWFDPETGQYHQEVYPVGEKKSVKPLPKVNTTGDIQYLRNQNFMKGLIAVLVFCLIMVGVIVLIFKFLSGDFSNSSDRNEAVAITDDTTEEDSSNEKDTNDTSIAEILTEDPDRTSEDDLNHEEYDSVYSSDYAEETAEEVAEEDVMETSDSNKPYLGMFIDADFDIPRAFAPVLYFKDNSQFEMMLNFTEGTQMYYGQYSVEDYSDAGIIYLNLYGYEQYNGIPSEAKVMFNTDNYNTCWFMNDGFGLMGYSGPSYEFYRDTR